MSAVAAGTRHPSWNSPHALNHRAVLLLAVGQSKLLGVAFGLWLAHSAAEVTALQAAMVLTLWMFPSWSVWQWARRRFWPADLEQ